MVLQGNYTSTISDSHKSEKRGPISIFSQNWYLPTMVLLTAVDYFCKSPSNTHILKQHFLSPLSDVDKTWWTATASSSRWKILFKNIRNRTLRLTWKFSRLTIKKSKPRPRNIWNLIHQMELKKRSPPLFLLDAFFFKIIFLLIHPVYNVVVILWCFHFT